MTTSISIRRHETLIGTCGPSCYNAANQHCRCICEGQNHGRGEAKTIRNAPKLLENLAERYPDPDHHITLNVTVNALCHSLHEIESSSDSTPQEISDRTPSSLRGRKEPSGS